MGNCRKILVAFDGSESSKNALRQAIKFADSEKSWIKVVAVVPTYEGDLELVGVSNIEEVLRSPTEKLLSEANAIANAEGVHVLTDVEQGKPYEKIVDVADNDNCDVIFVGRRGVHRIERALMGSVTAGIIGHAKTDVLVVPKNASLKWDNILLATDGSKYSEIASEHAIDIAKSYGGRLVVVSVSLFNVEFYSMAPKIEEELVQKTKAIVEKVREKAETAGVKAEAFIKEGDAYEKILELAEEQKADILVMGSHGRTGLKRLLMGSVVEKVIGLFNGPVYVVKARET